MIEKYAISRWRCSFCFERSFDKYVMDDDYTDEDDKISIWKLCARPSYPADDPRYLSPEMRDRLAQARLAQMRKEAEENIALLRAAEERRRGKI